MNKDEELEILANNQSNAVCTAKVILEGESQQVTMFSNIIDTLIDGIQGPKIAQKLLDVPAHEYFIGLQNHIVYAVKKV